MIIELAKTAVTALHVELLDSKKATFKYLSVSDSQVCYKNVSEQTKKSCIGCKRLCLQNLCKSTASGRVARAVDLFLRSRDFVSRKRSYILQ